MELTVNNLTKKYGKDTYGLYHYSVTFDKGITGLLAPNGAGKTTLLKILATIMKPTEGNVLYDGSDIFDLGSDYRDLIGYLPQNFGVYPNFTAVEFLKYFSTLKGINKSDINKRIEEVLDIVSLLHVKNRKLKTYSGGMKQRIGIAQALLNHPKILIIDEPTVGLDPEERIKFRNLLSEISGDRIIILSTHIVSDVEAIAGNIVFMNKGQLLEKTSPQKILEKMEGKVYKATVSQEDFTKIKKDYIVSNAINRMGGVEVRIVGDQPFLNAEVIEPTLEDVYLNYYQGK